MDLQTVITRATRERPAPAYLLVGPATEAAALEFARRLLCGDKPCPKVDRRTHPDLRWVEVTTGQWIGIDQVRALQEDALYPPSEGPYKVYVIAEAERLTLEAANSLLRILEDPPPFLVFLLLTESLELLPTVISRCQVIRLTPPSRAELLERLRAQGYQPQEAAYLLAVCGPEWRSLEEISASVEEPLAARAHWRELFQAQEDPELIGAFHIEMDRIAEYEFTLELLRRLGRWRAWQVLEFAYRWKELERERLARFFQRLVAWGRDLLLLELGLARAEDLFMLESDLEPWRGQIPVEGLIRFLPGLTTAAAALRGNANIQLLLEARLLRLWELLRGDGR